MLTVTVVFRNKDVIVPIKTCCMVFTDEHYGLRQSFFKNRGGSWTWLSCQCAGPRHILLFAEMTPVSSLRQGIAL